MCILIVKKTSVPLICSVVFSLLAAPLLAQWVHIHPGEDHAEIDGYMHHSHLHSPFQHQEEEYESHHPDECSYHSHLILYSIDLLNVGIIDNSDYSSTRSVLRILSLNNLTVQSQISTACGYYLKFLITTLSGVFASHISPPLLI